jgi:hypothetical protein
MEYAIGIVLALAVAGFAAVTGLDRERGFYPTVMIVIAAYYVLFAVMGGSSRALWIEIAAASGFSALAVIGFKRNIWLVAAALVAHGMFDFVHQMFIADPGVPEWWPGFCGAFDVIAGAWLGFRCWRVRLRPAEPIR